MIRDLKRLALVIFLLVACITAACIAFRPDIEPGTWAAGGVTVYVFCALILVAVGVGWSAGWRDGRRYGYDTGFLHGLNRYSPGGKLITEDEP